MSDFILEQNLVLIHFPFSSPHILARQNSQFFDGSNVSMFDYNPWLERSVHYERIEETDSKEEDAPPLQIEMETTSIPLQTSEPSEPERIEKSAETETAPSKGSLPKPESEACLPPSALSFLEQLKASFRKPSGNRKRKKVQRTMMIEEIISDEEDTAEYTEVFLKQLKDVCNESPTAYDPKIEVQILQIEPNENICSESELQSVTSLEQSSEPKR
eukprot:XP_017949510.1 PREDICTED: uncharacterized protein LOC105945482 [Xenopus tropicalis]